MPVAPKSPDRTLTSKMLEKVAGIEARAKSKKVAEVPSAEIEFEAVAMESIAQLPVWHETVRGIPNALARGALFTAGKDEPRAYMTAVKVATLSNIVIVYQGQELRQDDASVFMTIVHMARKYKLGDRVEFTAYQILRDLGWTNNEREYRRLRQCFDRLSATSLKVQVANSRAGYAGSLIRSFEWRDAQGVALQRWCVLLEPRIVALFGSDAFTLIEWEERKEITHRAPLALWLHTFLCTHDQPLAIGVAKYKELCGSQEKSLGGFRSRLLTALHKLQRIGFLKDFQIVNDLVHVRRAPADRGRQRQIEQGHQLSFG